MEGFFFGGGEGLRHLPSPNPLRDFKTLYFETSTHLQISENIPWWSYGYFLEQHNYIFNWGLQWYSWKCSSLSQILPQETRMQSDALSKWKPCLI